MIDSPLTRELTRQGRRRDWMAAQLGVKPWTFSRIEGGGTPVPNGWYERAAAVLGVNAEDIAPEELAHSEPAAA